MVQQLCSDNLKETWRLEGVGIDSRLTSQRDLINKIGEGEKYAYSLAYGAPKTY